MTKLRLSACAAGGIVAVLVAPDWIELNATLAILIWITVTGGLILLSLRGTAE